MRIKRIWKKEVAKKIEIPFYEVDAHNIVPCLFVSNKLEFAAYTIRPKIHKLLPEFLDEFTSIRKIKKIESLTSDKINWDRVIASLKINREVKELDWLKSLLQNYLNHPFIDPLQGSIWNFCVFLLQ